MIDVLIRRFVPNYDNVADKVVRERYSVLAGVLGILCNLLLFCLKLCIGIFMNSISILSDAFNNLADMGSSVITIFGAKLSNKHPDREHPFGHGRLEYISAFIVSCIIVVVGFELLRSSVDKIFNPTALNFSVPAVCILTASLFVKIWMFSYNRNIAKRINSSVLKAAGSDSLNDAAATGAVVIATVLQRYVDLPIDGCLGAAVAVMIMIGGIKIAKDVIGELLGKPPEPELVKSINDIVTSGEGVIGVHDLIVHNYGPGRVFASVHAEVADNTDIVRVHEVIDEAEHCAFNTLGVVLVIHMDPVSVDCMRTGELHQAVLGEVRKVDSVLSIHDFRITDGENRINLIFDVVVPVDTDDNRRAEIVREISERVSRLDSRYRCVIHVDSAIVYE